MKTILITGAATGIGESLAKLLSADNKLILTYHQTQPSVRLSGARYMELDLLDDKSIVAFADKLKADNTEIDILINNAGVCHDKKFTESSFSDIKQQIGVNLEGLIKLTLSTLPLVKEKIINIASECAVLTYPNYVTYCASKFGVRGFTQALATEEEGIGIYCVNPGPTSTKMNGFQGASSTDVAQKIIDQTINFTPPSGSDINIYEQFNFT
jgi:short-subunit dehydrogenase